MNTDQVQREPIYFASKEGRDRYRNIAYGNERLADLVAAYVDTGSYLDSPDLSIQIWAQQTRASIEQAVASRLPQLPLLTDKT